MDNQNNNSSLKISIIIPFYDSEDYVARCIDSVLNQDMPDFEIIAVNDGSPDTTPQLLEEYARKDSRIKVIHLKNGGIGWARNQGVAKATGEYIMFIDGDDFILPGCLSKLYNYADYHNADVVIYTYKTWEDGVFGESSQFSYPQNVMIDALAATKAMLLEGDYLVWNKIIKRNLYVGESIGFVEGSTVEDPPVGCKMLTRARRIVYLDTALYAYVQRNTSVSHALLTTKKIRDFIYAFALIEEEMKEVGWQYKLADVFAYRYICVFMSFFQVCYSNPHKYESIEELNYAKSILKEIFSKISYSLILSNQYLKISYKIKAVRLKSGIYGLEKAITSF